MRSLPARSTRHKVAARNKKTPENNSRQIGFYNETVWILLLTLALDISPAVHALNV